MSIRVLRHTSRVLRGNALGDPADREIWVYLPPGYEESGLSYPVLWCLVGFTGTGAMIVAGNRWAPGLAERLDRLIAGGCPPVIVAFPDCFTRVGGSQYLNSAATGRYEDYVCDELVPFVDANLRTLPRRDARGVFGKSSGGYGTLSLAMRRPGLFAAAACHSGDLLFEYCYVPDFARCAARIAKAGSLEKWFEEFESTEKKKSADFAAINAIGMAACYSPASGEPLGLALPFDLETGAMRDEVWRRWKENDPVEMVRRSDCAEALRGLKLLYLDCGSDDEYQLHLGQRLFCRRLQEAGIAHESQEFPDDHRSISYRYDVSVPKLASVLDAAAPA
jgi:enterochelin esterase family protein